MKKEYTHEGTLVRFHEFTRRDTEETRTVRLRRTPKFWCSVHGAMYSAEDGWPRYRYTSWRLDVDSVRELDSLGMVKEAESQVEKSRQVRLRMEGEYK